MTKQQIITSLAVSKPNLKVCDFTYTQNGTDELGLPTYQIDYVTPPVNYKLIRTIDSLKVAILEDLNYVAPII